MYTNIFYLSHKFMVRIGTSGKKRIVIVESRLVIEGLFNLTL